MKCFPVILAGLVLCTILSAGPVRHRQVVLSQPDGSTITAIISGDEFSHSVRYLSGNCLGQDEKGYWRTIPAPPCGEPGKRALRNSIGAKRLRRMSLRPETGAKGRHSIIILAEFPDLKMTATREDFVRLLTEEGYSDNGAAGSAKDYFDDQMRGDYEFAFEISEIVTLDHESSYYFGNNTAGNDKNPEEAIVEACEKAYEAGTSFAQGDDDGDSEVDNVFVFVAGTDEADGGGEDKVWSHMFYISETRYRGFSIDGVTINNYAISTEMKMTSPGEYTFTSIGTFCHEYSHAIGLMDMYDTDYGGSGGYGNGLWATTALMDYGCTNNDFITPAAYSAADYDMLSLGNCERLHPGSYVLEPITQNRRYLRYDTAVEGEYFLLECRSNTGWDEWIGGAGLAIYHIDKSSQPAGKSDYYGSVLKASDRWLVNEINCRPEHQCATLVPTVEGLKAFNGNGKFQFNQDLAFWKEGEFTPTSSPAFTLWNGEGSTLAITDIEMVGECVSFTVTAVEEVEVPSPAIGRIEVFQDAAIIRWEASESTYEGEATVVCRANDSGKEKSFAVQPYEAGKYAITLEGLDDETAYTAEICFRIGSAAGRTVPVSFTTKRWYTEGYPFIFLNNVPRLESGCFGKGAELPLRVYNAYNADTVTWYLDGKQITTGADGYYHIEKSGELKAEIRFRDGSRDIIIRKIVVE